MTLDQYVTDETGKPNVGNTPENIGQCVGLVEVWFRDNLDPQVWGNAKDLYDNADPNYYLKGTAWPAPLGAAAVFNWAPVGHTAISLGDDRLFEQNNPTGSTPHVSNYGAGRPNGYVGYIVPKNLNGDTEVIKDANHLQALFRRFRGRLATDGEVAQYVGKVDYAGLIEALDQGAEANAVAQYLAVGRTAVHDKWDSQIYGLEAENKKLTDELSAKAATTSQDIKAPALQPIPAVADPVQVPELVTVPKDSPANSTSLTPTSLGQYLLGLTSTLAASGVALPTLGSKPAAAIALLGTLSTHLVALWNIIHPDMKNIP
jgi:hypothetical protein